MPETGASQWIYTHPEEGAPRTGEGIFPMEVVEVVQVGGQQHLDVSYLSLMLLVLIARACMLQMHATPGVVAFADDVSTPTAAFESMSTVVYFPASRPPFLILRVHMLILVLTVFEKPSRDPIASHEECPSRALGAETKVDILSNERRD